jgi:hypothetical protein
MTQASAAASSSSAGNKGKSGGVGGGGSGGGTGGLGAAGGMAGRGGRKDGRGDEEGREEVSWFDIFRDPFCWCCATGWDGNKGCPDDSTSEHMLIDLIAGREQSKTRNETKRARGAQSVARR